MLKFTTLLLLTITLLSCKSKYPTSICDPAPPPSLSDFMFRIVDNNTGEELLIPGKLHPDSARVTQACNSKTDLPVRRHEGYLASQNGLTGSIDSSKVVYPFTIDSLKPKYNNEAAECENVYIYWNNLDTDTLRLSSSGDGCEVPRVTTITFNGTVVQKQSDRVTFNGFMYTYYLLKK